MIRIHLSRILGEKKMKMADLSRQTNINAHAISDLYYERAKAIYFDTLDKICEALGCSVSELVEYQPDKKEEEKVTS
jgi:putative transcriptional regulator